MHLTYHRNTEIIDAVNQATRSDFLQRGSFTGPTALFLFFFLARSCLKFGAVLRGRYLAASLNLPHELLVCRVSRSALV